MVIVESGNVATGQSFNATICDGNRRWPVQAKRLNAQTLLIEPNDPRDIVSTVVEDGTTSLVVGPGRKTLIASVRRARLAKANELSR
jgi:hypothetical protein